MIQFKFPEIWEICGAAIFTVDFIGKLPNFRKFNESSLCEFWSSEVGHFTALLFVDRRKSF